MGMNYSCKRLSLSSTSEPGKVKNNHIRVIHMNGYIEELEHPVTVGQLTGKPAKHFVFSHLHHCAPKPLKVDALLEAGKVYFLLPYSLFNSNVSPSDLAPLVRKLTSIAKSGKPNSSSSSSPLRTTPNDETSHGLDKSAKSRSWKPILSTIKEKSFNRRTESDLQDN